MPLLTTYAKWVHVAGIIPCGYPPYTVFANATNILVEPIAKCIPAIIELELLTANKTPLP